MTDGNLYPGPKVFHETQSGKPFCVLMIADKCLANMVDVE